jgi:hypothetical protein
MNADDDDGDGNTKTRRQEGPRSGPWVRGGVVLVGEVLVVWLVVMFVAGVL